MKRLTMMVYKLDLSFQVLAGLGLAFMMLLTLTDVIMRALGRPIVGSIELVCFSGAIVIGFAIPYSSLKRVHIFVDLVTKRLSPRSAVLCQGVTTSVGVVLFLFIGYNFIVYGLDLIRTGEVSAGLKIPYYPITFGLAASCLLESLTLFCQLLQQIGRRTDE
jgi:TRAP-type C4-dicarboxylate transport system permease small subunit